MTAAILAIDDAFEILGSYVITFAVIGTFAAWVLRNGRSLADQVDDDDKYWT